MEICGAFLFVGSQEEGHGAVHQQQCHDGVDRLCVPREEPAES